MSVKRESSECAAMLPPCSVSCTHTCSTYSFMSHTCKVSSPNTANAVRSCMPFPVPTPQSSTKFTERIGSRKRIRRAGSEHTHTHTAITHQVSRCRWVLIRSRERPIRLERQRESRQPPTCAENNLEICLPADGLDSLPGTPCCDFYNDRSKVHTLIRRQRAELLG